MISSLYDQSREHDDASMFTREVACILRVLWMSPCVHTYIIGHVYVSWGVSYGVDDQFGILPQLMTHGHARSIAY